MTSPESRPFRLNWLVLSALCLLCIAGCLRFSDLSNLPGINADEADMGVRILQMLHGQSYSLRSPTGQFFNPLFILSETCLLKWFPPNFYLLRLPAALFAALGIVALVYLYGRLFGDWMMALLLGVLTACFPIHLLFSRLGWDATFVLFWTPLILLFSLRLLSTPRRHDFAGLLFCIPLIIWTHSTAAIFVLAVLAAMFWVRRDAIAQWLCPHLPKSMSRHAPTGTSLFCLSVVLGAIVAWICWFVLAAAMVQIQVLAPNYALRVLEFPGSLVLHLRLLGDLLTGYRGFIYVAGFPDSNKMETIGWIAEMLLIFGVIKLVQSLYPADRFLATLLVFYMLLILLTAGILHLYLRSHLRYLTPLMVLLPLIVVRAFPRPIFLLLLGTVMLGEYWVDFERPALECRYIGNTEMPYWTGLREPKAEAAKLILQLTANSDRQPVVYTDTYWLERPLEFLLYGQLRVVNQWPQAQRLQPGDFIAGFANENLIEKLPLQLAAASRLYAVYPINNQSDVPQILLLQVIN